MKIFLAGATGAVGRQLVPLLAGAGHDVVGTTRTAGKAEELRRAGAEPVVLDLLDADAVVAAVGRARPEVVVHEATALSSMGGSVRRFDDEFAATNRLRTDGTDNLLAAARAAGVRRIVAQSYAGWPYAREGGPVKTEEDPLDPEPAAAFRKTLAAIRYLEGTVGRAEDVEGVVLRYGALYGPGTSIAANGTIVQAVKKRRFPVVGGGAGVWSFVHVADAAAATVAAVERGAPGIYNIVDDEPAPVSAWLPALADAVGAKPPRRVPAWLGRLAGGEALVVLMTQIRGASNEKARRELGWAPAHATWHEGFRELAAPTPRRSASPSTLLQS